MSAELLLRKARFALWDSIATYTIPGGESLNERIKRKYRFDDKKLTNRDPIPTRGDLPALSIYPAPSVPKWKTNQRMVIPYVLQCILWTREWDMTTAEELWQRINEAFFQSKPDGLQVTYIQRAIGNVPVQIGTFVANRAELAGEGGAATTWVWPIELLIDWTPTTD